MSTLVSTSDLIKELPTVRGNLQTNVPLANYTWFRTGGNAEILFTPEDPDDLVNFLNHCSQKTPFTVIGLGSNVLIRDGGIAGVVIQISRRLGSVRVQGSDLIVGAGAADAKVSRIAAGAGVSGIEFLNGVPGSIGGAIRMNAGAFGQEVSEVLISATIVDEKGTIRTQNSDAFCFGYRKSTLPSNNVIVEARLRGKMGVPFEILQRMKRVANDRMTSPPIKMRTGGSTFTNPPGQTAWRLIDRAGCRGLKLGGARVSEKHCNFIINTGNATSADIEDLGNEVRRRVFDEPGVLLSWEIQIFGCPNSLGQAVTE